MIQRLDQDEQKPAEDVEADEDGNYGDVIVEVLLDAVVLVVDDLFDGVDDEQVPVEEVEARIEAA